LAAITFRFVIHLETCLLLSRL